MLGGLDYMDSSSHCDIFTQAQIELADSYTTWKL